MLVPSSYRGGWHLCGVKEIYVSALSVLIYDPTVTLTIGLENTTLHQGWDHGY